MLGKNGVFGEQVVKKDKRHWFLKRGLGVFGTGFAIVINAFTNALDVACTFVSHNISSVGFTVANNWHLLGKNGVFGEQILEEDKRHWALKWVAGVFGTGFAVVINAFTNTFDAACTGTWHFAANFTGATTWTFSKTYSLLSLGNSSLIFRGKEPVASTPSVVVPNVLRGVRAAISEKGVSQSASGVVVIQNVLHKATLADQTFESTADVKVTEASAPPALDQSEEDPQLNPVNVPASAEPEEVDINPTQAALSEKMTISQKIIFSFFVGLSSPVWFSAALVTNLFDVLISVPGHTLYQSGASIRSLIRNNYNWVVNQIVGPGVLGKNLANDDQRSLALRIPFGLITSFIWLPFVVLSNLFDMTATLISAVSVNAGLSFYHLFHASYHGLGRYGVMGEVKPYADTRPVWLQVVSGIIPALILAIPLAATNLIDGGASFSRYVAINFYVSLVNNFRAYYRALSDRVGDSVLWSKLVEPVLAAPEIPGQVGVDSAAPSEEKPVEKAKEEDPSELNKKRTWLGFVHATIFATLSSPLWLLTVLFLNALDFVLVTIKHFSYNFWTSVKHNFSFYNYVLGPYGLMGERTRSVDMRPWYVQVPFFLLTCPVFLAVALINMGDIVASTGKYVGVNFANSLGDIWQNYPSVLAYWNGSLIFASRQLVKAGSFTDRAAPVAASTPLPSAPPGEEPVKIDEDNPGVVVAEIMPTIAADPTVEGKRDSATLSIADRGVKAFIWLLGFIVSFPFLLLVNGVDFAIAGIYHSGLSFGVHVVNYWNLFGESGVFGKKVAQEDGRHWFLRFGPTAWLPVILGLLVTVPMNALNFVFTSVWHIAKSYYENYLPMANFLGENGVFGKRRPYSDKYRHNNEDRAIAIRIIAGIFSFPVLFLAGISNTVDLLASTFMHAYISLENHVVNYWNLFGKSGVFGEKTAREDARHGFLRFGPTAWLGVGLALLVTAPLNVLNFVLTSVWHMGKSFYENYLSNANWLGENGIFGKRHLYSDDRHMAIRVIAGLPSIIPIVFLAVISNVADCLLTVIKHMALALTSKWFWRDVVATGLLVVSSPIWWVAAFSIRKVFHSFFNLFIRPWVDLAYGRGFNASRWFGSLLPLITLGFWSLGKLLIKILTGYSSRFGFERGSIPVAAGEKISYEAGRGVFREAITLAKKGDAIPDVPHSSATSFRGALRAVGLRSSEEKIAKRFHDAYETVSQKRVVNKQTFFNAPAYCEAKQSLIEDFSGYSADQDLLVDMEKYFKARFGL